MSKQKLSVKWFGSFSSRSNWRLSDKTDPKITSKPDGSQRDKMPGDNSVNDMDTCLHSPGHVATVARKERQKPRKAAKKKRRNKEEIHQDPSQCQIGDSVRDSPLLSVLSGTHLSALEKQSPSSLQRETLPVAQTPVHSPQPFPEEDRLPFSRGSFQGCKTTTLNRHSGNQDAPSTSEVLPAVNSTKTGTDTGVYDRAVMPFCQRPQCPSDSASATTLYKDMYVLMDPIAEEVNSHAEKKTWDVYSWTPGDLKRRETLDSQLEPMDSKGEYVKFSKDGSWLDFPSEKLRRELEEELKLSSSNLMSHGWYHGNIPWELSETLVLNHGDFLIRESLSSQGDYVLTSHWSNKTLHFLISRVLVRKGESHTRVQYTLEGEAFHSLPALVNFYVGNKVALTQQSGAQIHRPVNRTLPLRYRETAFSLANHKADHRGCLNSHYCQQGSRGALVNSCSGNVTDRICPLSPSAVHHRGAVKSFSLPSSPTEENPLSVTFSTQQARSPPVLRLPGVMRSPAVSSHSRSRTQTHLSPFPFPKNNTPATKWATIAQSPSTLLTTDTQQTTTAQASSYCSLSTNSQQTRIQASPDRIYLTPDTDSQQTRIQASPDRIYLTPDTDSQQTRIQVSPDLIYLTPDTDSQQTRIQVSPDLIYLTPDTDSSSSRICLALPPAQSHVARLCAEKEGLSVGDPVKEDNGNVYEDPIAETASALKPRRYRSLLMPTENRPLEMGILRRVKELLAQVDAKTLATHITKADCMAARILYVTPETQRKMGVSSGMELLTLPHGHQLRLDLLERFQTMSLMLAVDVLGCTGSAEERAALLHKAIEMAAELKNSLGNMFGFAAIMRALELPQISRLEQTWMVLRQRHTEGAVLYEKTLKPFMKRMNDGKETCALANTSFPHVLPLLSLLEKSVAVADGAEPWETAETGVDVLMSHLEAARTIAQLGGIYRTNAEAKLKGFQEQAEVLELFLTEFEMRLLWGSRGAEENQDQRYAKFDQVLSALSNKLEPPHLAQ
ncbi:SH2 domain containing 3Cb isoform X1 [Esox lucius]|uniref:SH2 domain containing 3Cb n=2 Tax=Esox lucius TaxID=8010 RepID=A0A3P9A6B0_ESOLU|nr:SH2 domain containing 3Cb isoform X1 [Esox lucius]